MSGLRAPRALGGFLSQSSAVIAANLATAALSVGYVALVSRKLGPSGYGELTAAVALGNLLLLFLGPLNGTLVKFAAGYHRDGERARLAALLFGNLRRLRWPAAGALGLAMVLSPLLRRLAHIDSRGVFFALLLFVLASALTAFPRSALSGEQRFAAFGSNQVFEALLRLLLGGALVLLGQQAAGAMAGYALGIGGALALGLFQMRHLSREPPAPIDTRGLLSFSVAALLVYAWFVCASNLDVVIARDFLSTQDSGLYGAASGLARLLFLMGTPIYAVLFARVSSLRAGADRRLLSMQVLALMALGLAASFAFPWFGGARMLRLLFGDAFVGALPILRILWIATSLLVLQVAAAHYLLAIERLRAAALFLLPCALLAGLLAWRHGSLSQIAGCVLASSAFGLLLTALLVFREPGSEGAA